MRRQAIISNCFFTADIIGKDFLQSFCISLTKTFTSHKSYCTRVVCTVRIAVQTAHIFFPLAEGCSEGLDAFSFFFRDRFFSSNWSSSLINTLFVFPANSKRHHALLDHHPPQNAYFLRYSKERNPCMPDDCHPTRLFVATPPLLTAAKAKAGAFGNPNLSWYVPSQTRRCSSKNLFQ